MLKYLGKIPSLSGLYKPAVSILMVFLITYGKREGSLRVHMFILEKKKKKKLRSFLISHLSLRRLPRVTFARILLLPHLEINLTVKKKKMGVGRILKNDRAKSKANSALIQCFLTLEFQDGRCAYVLACFTTWPGLCFMKSLLCSNLVSQQMIHSLSGLDLKCTQRRETVK